MFKKILAAFAFFLGAATAAQAGPISTETWYAGSFNGAVGNPVVGGTSGGGGADPGAPAWTFSIADGHELIVIDCCNAGDAFEIFNFGSSIGVTTVGTNGAGCFTAASCLADPTVGRGTFALGAGNHSLTMTVFSTTNVGSQGNLFFRVNDTPDGGQVPEPGTFLLAGAALLGLGVSRKRAAHV